MENSCLPTLARPSWPVPRQACKEPGAPTLTPVVSRRS